MVKLRLAPIKDDKPVRLTVEIPASLHRELVLYGEILGRSGGQGAVQPQKLIMPMLERFIASDRGFTKARRNVSTGHGPGN